MAIDGFPNAEFYGNKHLGRKSIALLFKDSARLLGLLDNFCPHSLCGACITQLVNDSNVSIAEMMVVAWHTSVSASRAYQQVDGVSEGNRLCALGLLETVPADPVKTSVEVSEPTTVPPTGLAKPPADPVSKPVAKCCLSQMESDSKDEFEAFHAKHRRRNSGPSESSSGDCPVKTKSATAKPQDMSMTQMDIAVLNNEVADLEDSMKPKKLKAVPPKSENHRVVAELREVVCSLQKKVDSHDHNILYYRSLENNQEEKLDHLKEDLEQEQSKNYKLEREIQLLEADLRNVRRDNRELGCIVFGKRRTNYY